MERRATWDGVQGRATPAALASSSVPVAAATVEQIIFHLAGEEMIHMGEVLAMTRQLGIDLPSYFLMSIMAAEDQPWQQWSAVDSDIDAQK